MVFQNEHLIKNSEFILSVLRFHSKLTFCVLADESTTANRRLLINATGGSLVKKFL